MGVRPARNFTHSRCLIYLLLREDERGCLAILWMQYVQGCTVYKCITISIARNMHMRIHISMHLANQSDSHCAAWQANRLSCTISNNKHDALEMMAPL